MSHRSEQAHPRTARLTGRYLALQDFEQGAKRRLPRPLFGYVAGGAESNLALRANYAALQSFGFVTRGLRNLTQRSLAVSLLGKTFALPVGIAPMGISALYAYRGDVALARAAAARNVPMIMSGASLIPVEEVLAANPDIWFQAYLLGETDGINLM